MQKRGSCKLFNNKKAEGIETEIYYTIFEIVLVGIVVVALFAYIDSIRKDTMFEKTYLAKDLALMMDTIYAAPGNLRLSYSHQKLNISEFNFNFINQKAAVVESNIEGALELKYPFAADSYFLDEIDQIKVQKEIPIQKTGESIKIKNVLPQKLNLLSCPAKELQKLSSDKIYVSQESINEIKIPLKATLQLGDSITDETEAIIGFHATTEQTDVIEAYVNANSPFAVESKQIACKIINNILIDPELSVFSSGQIKSIDTEDLKEDSPLKTILNTNEISFVMVFNIDKINSIDFSKKRDALIPAIRKPIDEIIQK